MDKIIYRKALKKDLPQIIALLAQVNFDKIAINAENFWVASIQTSIVGCGQIIAMADGNIELASVVVSEKMRGQGIGGKLVKKIISQEKRRPVYLMCRMQRQNFYERAGFEEIDDAFLPPIYQAKVKNKRKEVKKANIKGLAMVKKN